MRETIHCEYLLAFLFTKPSPNSCGYGCRAPCRPQRPQLRLIVFINLVTPFCKHNLYLHLSFLVQLPIILQLLKVFIKVYPH